MSVKKCMRAFIIVSIIISLLILYLRRLFNSIYTSGGKVAVVELKSPQINISPNHKFPKFCQQRCGDINKLYHGLKTN